MFILHVVVLLLPFFLLLSGVFAFISVYVFESQHSLLCKPLRVWAFGLAFSKERCCRVDTGAKNFELFPMYKIIEAVNHWIPSDIFVDIVSTTAENGRTGWSCHRKCWTETYLEERLFSPCICSVPIRIHTHSHLTEHSYVTQFDRFQT